MTGLIPADEADRIDAEAAASDKVSFSREGYERRRPTWDDSDMGHVAGRTVVVTGATAGLGRATAEGLARLGARVVLVSRDSAKLDSVAAAIASATGNHALGTVAIDLASLDSVRAGAATLLAREPELHVLVNNAGIMVDERRESVDGYELTWATNVIGPYLLTELLLPRLVRTATAAVPARIIEVTSGGAYSQGIDVDDPMTERRPYEPQAVYSRTKRAQIILTEQRAARLAPEHVVAHVMHPGWAETPGLLNTAAMAKFVANFGYLLRTPQQGADTTVWLAAADRPASCSGLFWQDRRPRETHRSEATHDTPQDRERLEELLRGYIEG